MPDLREKDTKSKMQRKFVMIFINTRTLAIDFDVCPRNPGQPTESVKTVNDT